MQGPESDIGLAAIYAARRRLAGRVVRTPLILSGNAVSLETFDRARALANSVDASCH